MQAYLTSGSWPTRASRPLVCEAPLLWVSPSAVEPGATALPHGGLVLRTGTLCDRGTLVVRQGSRVLWCRRTRRLVPNRSIRAAVRWRVPLDPEGGPLVVALER